MLSIKTDTKAIFVPKFIPQIITFVPPDDGPKNGVILKNLEVKES